MLMFYYAVARKLRPLQPLWLILTLLSLCMQGYLIFLAPVALSQRWQLTTLLTFAFFLNIMLLIILFGQPQVDTGANDFWSRLQFRIHYLFSYLLAWLVTGLFIVIIWLFLRIALGIVVRMVF
jgi:hypothetical protein